MLGPIKCTACKKSVYQMDPQINLDGTIFHKACAKCSDCKCQITLTNFAKNSLGNDCVLLCKTHQLSRFHTSGAYMGAEKFKLKSERDIKSLEQQPPSLVLSANDIITNNSPHSLVHSINEDSNNENIERVNSMEHRSFKDAKAEMDDIKIDASFVSTKTNMPPVNTPKMLTAKLLQSTYSPELHKKDSKRRLAMEPNQDFYVNNNSGGVRM